MERIRYTKQRNANKNIKDTFIYQAELNQHTSKMTNIEWNIKREITDAGTKKEKINV